MKGVCQMLEFPDHKPETKVPKFLANMIVYQLVFFSCFFHWLCTVVEEKELKFRRYHLIRDTRKLAKVLLALGVQRGEIVTTYCSRVMYGNIVNFLACNRIRATMCFHNERDLRANLIDYLTRHKSRVLITYNQTSAWISALKAEVPGLKYVINMTSPHDQKIFKHTILETYLLDNTQPVTEFLKGQHVRLPRLRFNPEIDPHDTVLITLSSGSTDGPKEIEYDDWGIVHDMLFSKRASDVRMWDRKLHLWGCYVFIDCFYGLVTSALAPICGGCCLAVMPDLCDANVSYYFAKPLDVFFGTPASLLMVVNNLAPHIRLSRLKMFACGGDWLPPDFAHDAIAFFKSHGVHPDFKIANGLGTTETGGLISTGVGDVEENVNSVGKIIADAFILLLQPKEHEDDSDVEVGFGEQGELWVAGEHITKGFHDNTELNQRNFKEIAGRRYVRTGNIVIIEPDRRTYLVARDEFFIVQQRIDAFKVYPDVVTNALNSASPLIENCRVVKGPGDTWDFEKNLGTFVSCAFVKTAPGVPHTDETIRQILEDAKQHTYPIGNHTAHLKDYEIPQPDRVYLVDELPLTRAGKVDFRLLEREAIARAREERLAA